MYDWGIVERQEQGQGRKKITGATKHSPMSTDLLAACYQNSIEKTVILAALLLTRKS
jgi:hypothetical protein